MKKQNNKQKKTKFIKTIEQAIAMANENTKIWGDDHYEVFELMRSWELFKCCDANHTRHNLKMINQAKEVFFAEMRKF